MNDVLRDIISKRQSGTHCGIPSYCTANELVIEALFEQAKKIGDAILIEATANQVNQFGGYTGMQPVDFKNFVYEIADKVGFDKDKIILGGDHLGPLTWANLPEDEAMTNAIELVKLFVLAGFKKIHLDTSMRLASDDTTAPLSDATIARRGVTLYKACEEAYQELVKINPSETRPVFIIGSEVPIPGGATEEEDTIAVTKPEDFETTIDVYRQTFEKEGISDAFENIIAVVVQPGVEFGDADIFHYNSVAASNLCQALSNHPTLVFEGHSTDYQSPDELRSMVADGIAILKVGPALTFSLREALFSLAMIEKELVPVEEQSRFIEVLEEVMLKNPDNWQRHYHGNDEELKLKRKYSFSDRSRYYMNDATIEATIAKLFANIDAVTIPLSMLHQYLPLQYVKVRDGKLAFNARSLAKDGVVNLVEDYNFAVREK
jgi:D-tagatose-1,6-bisphosphate aldolase subunit GatZ/KbaZ